MNPIFRLTTALLLFVLALTSQAYERPTHRALSKAAAPPSILQTDPGILSSLGLKASDTFRNSENDERTIFGLIEDGSDFEDGFPRSRHHFYDPLNGQGLTTSLISGTPSPDWALEDVSNITTQDYSYKHARDYLYKALTLPTQLERDQQFGQTFQTLGQVIHHLQDMAQPQHVRNDPHCDVFLLCVPLGQYNPSLYEAYTNDIRAKPEFTSLFGTYPPAIFDLARKFWTGGINGNGQGIADFSNRNFVSAGTNFDNPAYPRPFFSPATEHDENANLLLQSAGLAPPPECLPPNDPCLMTFYRNPVDDTYRPALNTNNDRTSTWSIFDQDLKVNNLGPAFRLNRFNFDAAYPFLIPRAVGYSAGLIDYFFRGKMDFIAHPSTPGTYAIENLSNEAMNGTFELHYDDINGNRQPVPGASWTLPVPANGQSIPLTFTGPTTPPPKHPVSTCWCFAARWGRKPARWSVNW